MCLPPAEAYAFHSESADPSYGFQSVPASGFERGAPLIPPFAVPAHAPDAATHNATKTATIGIKGTRFGVDYDKTDDSSQVSVSEGVVAAVPPPRQAVTEIAGPREIAPPSEVSQAQWQVLVGRDQKVIIRPGQDPKVVPMTDADRNDEWIAFNNKRDKEQAAR